MPFIGDGNRRTALEFDGTASGPGNVRFLPFQPREALRWTYATERPLPGVAETGLAGYIVPSKLYPILAAGRPYVAAVEGSSEVAALTTRHECGVVVTPGDAAALAAQILLLAADAAGVSPWATTHGWHRRCMRAIVKSRRTPGSFAKWRGAGFERPGRDRPV